MTSTRWRFWAGAALALQAICVAYFLFAEPIPFGAATARFFAAMSRDWAFPVAGAMGLLAVACMGFAAVGVGAWMLERFGAADYFTSVWQRLVFSILTGWIFLSIGTLALGLAGLCSRAGLGVFLALAAAWGIRGWSALVRRTLGRDGADGEGAAVAADFDINRWIVIGGLLIYVLAIPYAMTPAVESDELRYHLAAPEAYLEAGRIGYLPHQAFTNFPFQIEMLFTMAMALAGVEGAKLVHLSFLETSGALIGLLAFLLARVGAGRGRFDRGAARNVAAMAAIGFAAVPTSLIHAAWAFVDLATVAYLLAVVYLGALALTSRKPPPAWLAGLMAGGAVGTKYSMVPVMVFAIAVLAAMLMADPRRRSWAIRWCGRAAMFGAAAAAPWFLKNLVWTGNPFYPLAWDIFGGGEWSHANAEFQAAKMSEWGLAAQAALRSEPIGVLSGPLGRLLEFAITPVTTSIFWVRYHGNFLGPLPMMAMALAGGGWLARRRAGRGRRAGSTVAFAWVFAIVAGYWVLWFMSYQSNRILLPALGLIFALGGAGAGLLAARLGREWRWFARGGAALFGVAYLYSWAFAFSIIAAKPGAPLALGLGFGDAESMVAETVSYYPSARRLKGLLRDGERALLIGEHRPMYFGNGVVLSDWFDTPQPLPLIRETADNEELLDRLLAEGVRYVFINMHELGLYYGSYFAPRLTRDELARFELLLRDPRLREVYRDARYAMTIYEIEGGGSAER